MMKKVLLGLYALVTLGCLLYGIPMAIVNIGRDSQVVIIHSIIGVIGIALLFAGAFVLMKKKKQGTEE